MKKKSASIGAVQRSAVSKVRLTKGNIPEDANNVYALNLNETVNIINMGRGMKNNLTARQTKIMKKLKK